MKQNKDEIKKAVLSDTIAFFTEHGVEFPRLSYRENALGRCPFHPDRNPSFSVNLRNGLWKCFAGCGSGDLFSFYAKAKNLNTKKDFSKILDELSAWSKGASNGH